jgi:methylated-DNA-[protein]-cysteine S-methyltransferase
LCNDGVISWLHPKTPGPGRAFCVSAAMPAAESPAAQPYQAVVPLPLPGVKLLLGIVTSPQGLCSIDFLAERPTLAPADPCTTQVVAQLQDYVDDPRRGFALPLATVGTPFQRRVWEQLRQIPPGRPITYGELARRLGSGARAVANACRRNPVPIVVPCHRVVSHHGLGGYGGEVEGALPQLKQALLDHEAAYLD